MKFTKALLIVISLATVFHVQAFQKNNPPKLKSIVSPQTEVKLKGKVIELPKVATIGSYAYYASNGDGLPVIMVPGLGLSSWIFTNTPDGRESWGETFSEAGHDVYVYNDPAIFVNPELDYSEFMDQTSKWQAQRAWGTWGMGQRYPDAYENTRYPVEQFDQLLDNFPSYTSFASLEPSSGTSQGSGGGRGGRSRGGASVGNSIKVNNLLALIEEVGDCILMVHSMSGLTSVEAIKENSNHIKGFIVVEPVGSPTDEDMIKEHFASIPFLGVYGDFIDQRRQTGRKLAVQTTIDLINKNGGQAAMIDLPAMGIEGNTHLMMQDNNNQDIAALIMDWIKKSAQ